MTLSQFRNTISQKLGLDNTVAGDQPLIDQFVNEGYVDVLLRTHANVQVGTMTLTAGTGDYSTVPADIMAINELYVTDASNSVMSRMTRVSPAELLNMRVGSQNQGSPPVRFYALNGATFLMVFPTPVTADVLTVYYVPHPPALSAGSDVPGQLELEYHKAIEYYGLWQSADFVNDSQSQNGERYRQLYEAELAKIRKYARYRGGRKLSPAVVGRSGARTVGSPSQQGV